MSEIASESKEIRKEYWECFPVVEDRDDLWYHLSGAGKDWQKVTVSDLLYYHYRFVYEDVLISKMVSDHNFTRRALDCGCGTGRNSITLSRYFDKVVSFDISSKFIAANKRRFFNYKNIFFTVAGLLDFLIEIRDKQKYDLILVGGVFMCVSDEEVLVALNSINNLLSDNGILITRDTITRDNSRQMDGVKFFRTKPEYESLFCRTGFRIINIRNGANRNIFCSVFMRLPSFLRNSVFVFHFFSFCVAKFATLDALCAARFPFFRRHPLAHQLFYVFKKNI